MRKVLILGCLLLVFFLGSYEPGRAASGLPDSPEFGYGARLDLHGNALLPSLEVAASMGLDWISLDYDWAANWPDPAVPPDYSVLDTALGGIQRYQMYALVSITNPPPWAIGDNGPDAAATGTLITGLAQRYPESLVAIEPLPGANTSHGWGAAPNPAAYVALLQTAQASLQAIASPVTLVAGGLIPLASDSSQGMNDLAYLEALYVAGAQPYMSVVSLRLTETFGTPLSSPDAGGTPVLRHYEALRQVMTQHNHTDGLIWLTEFTWPATVIFPSQQILWIQQAYTMLAAQLYLGACFFNQLNSSPAEPVSLVGPDLHVQPALLQIGQTIEPGADIEHKIPTHYLVKRLIHKPDYKHSP